MFDEIVGVEATAFEAGLCDAASDAAVSVTAHDSGLDTGYCCASQDYDELLMKIAFETGSQRDMKWDLSWALCKR